MKEIIGVYMLLNKNTNQCYIGSSKNIDRRFYQHRYNKDRMTTKLYNDMKNNDFDFIKDKFDSGAVGRFPSPNLGLSLKFTENDWLRS